MTKYLVHLEHFDGSETNVFDTYEEALAWYNEAKDYETTQSSAEGFIDTDFKVYMCKIMAFSEFIEDANNETGEYYYTLQDYTLQEIKAYNLQEMKVEEVE